MTPESCYTFKHTLMQDMMIDMMAENERLSAIRQAQSEIFELEFSNTWASKFREIMAHVMRSPFSVFQFPFNLYKLWREITSNRSSRLLGGASFDAVLSSYKTGGFDAVKTLLTESAVSPGIRANGYIALSRYLMPIDPECACEAASLAYEADPRPCRRKWLAFRRHDAGDVTGADVLLAVLPTPMAFSPREAVLKQNIIRFARKERKLSASMKLAHIIPKKNDMPVFSLSHPDPLPPLKKDQSRGEGGNLHFSDPPESFFPLHPLGGEGRVRGEQMGMQFPADRLNRIDPQVDDPPLDSEKNDEFRWDGDRLYTLLKKEKRSRTSIDRKDNRLFVQSTLPDGRHDYLCASQDIPVGAIARDGVIKTYLDVSPGLHIQYALICFDKEKKRIGHVIHPVDKNNTYAFPDGTTFIRFWLRVEGGGQAVVRSLFWQHCRLAPERILHQSSVLLLTHHYPSDDDLYRNAFVHRRVKLYQARGVIVDVFRFRSGEFVHYHAFQNVDVITGGEDALHQLLGSGRISRVLVHFLSSAMWTILRCYPQIKMTVWVHGSEIQPWHRRAFNYSDAQALEKAKHSSQKRMQFWKETLDPLPSYLGLVFVSRYLAEEVMDDLGFRLPEDHYTIIHNPIDTTLFGYHPKPAHQRMRILSIRPYASPKYANDLTVQAILELSARPFFHELEFRLIGDGKLFDETVKPVLAFPNVRIERRFVTQTEMASLYLEYGVFLNPTRWDSQGVSRDEAMACGLVPITNKVSAIPEFVDERCGFLADPEDACGLASAIERLYESPALFVQMSRAAAKRVRRQSDALFMIEKELEWIGIQAHEVQQAALRHHHC
ncbi:glycosyltransferase family 4 protein [Desulfosarcina sp. OttesenSCG-928-A07]|nr:glycosyltransferase family 4 protein [Desulfosarcina sp. OttesenSCG-928-A07]